MMSGLSTHSFESETSNRSSNEGGALRLSFEETVFNASVQGRERSLRKRGVDGGMSRGLYALSSIPSEHDVIEESGQPSFFHERGTRSHGDANIVVGEMIMTPNGDSATLSRGIDAADSWAQLTRARCPDIGAFGSEHRGRTGQPQLGHRDVDDSDSSELPKSRARLESMPREQTADEQHTDTVAATLSADDDAVPVGVEDADQEMLETIAAEERVAAAAVPALMTVEQCLGDTKPPAALPDLRLPATVSSRLLHQLSADGLTPEKREAFNTAMTRLNGLMVNLEPNIDAGDAAVLTGRAKGALNVIATSLDLELDSGADSSLLLAARFGCVRLVNVLLGASVRKKTKKQLLHATRKGDDATALLVAAAAGHAEIVKRLLEEDTNARFAMLKLRYYDAYNRDTECSALVLATQQGHANVVTALLENLTKKQFKSKAAKDFFNFTDQSASVLHFAAANNHEGIIERVLQFKGLRMNNALKNGCKPVHLAALNGHAKIVQLLLAASNKEADPVLKGSRHTALHVAATAGTLEVVKVLLGAEQTNPCATDANGWTPLGLAAWHGHAEIVDLLHQHFLVDNPAALSATHVTRTDLHHFAVANTEWNAAHIAAMRGHKVVIEKIASDEKTNILVSQFDAAERTAEEIATLCGHLEVRQSINVAMRRALPAAMAVQEHKLERAQKTLERERRLHGKLREYSNIAEETV